MHVKDRATDVCVASLGLTIAFAAAAGVVVAFVMFERKQLVDGFLLRRRWR